MSQTKETCLVCEKKIKKSSSCDFDYIISLDEKTAKRSLSTKNCKICGVRKGKIHHVVCDNEICPICKEPLNTKKCKHDWADFGRSGQSKKSVKKEVFFVSTSAFTLLTIATFGLFPFYWMYRTWRFLLKQEGSRLNPVVVTILWPVYIWLFAKRIKKLTEECFYWHSSQFAIPIMIYLFYFLFAFDVTLFGLYLFSFFPFLNFQKSMNHVYVRMFPEDYQI